MRVGDEGREPPMRFPEPRNRAAEDQTPIDPDGMENRVPDRRGKVALDQVFPSQKIVAGAGLPVACPGLDGPGRGLAVSGYLRAADGGVELIQPAKLPQFGPEHAVILRQAARIVSLHIDDMAVLNAHSTSPDRPGDYIRPRNAPRANSGLARPGGLLLH